MLGHLLNQRDDPRPLRLLALRGSRSLAPYTRQGFVYERDHENGIDVVLARPPAGGAQAAAQQPRSPVHPPVACVSSVTAGCCCATCALQDHGTDGGSGDVPHSAGRTAMNRCMSHTFAHAAPAACRTAAARACGSRGGGRVGGAGGDPAVLVDVPSVAQP